MDVPTIPTTPPPLPQNFLEPENKLLSKKNILAFLFIGILLLIVPLAVIFVQERQVLKSRASSEDISFVGDNVSCDESGECVAKDPSVMVALTHTFPPPSITPTSSQPPTQTPTQIPTVTATPAPVSCAKFYGVWGHIKDPQGGPVQGVTVEVYSDKPGQKRTSMTDENGIFGVGDLICDADNTGYAVRVPSQTGISSAQTMTSGHTWNYAGNYAGKDTPVGAPSYEYQKVKDNDCAGPSPERPQGGRCDFKVTKTQLILF